jgi:hypothetical protein
MSNTKTGGPAFPEIAYKAPAGGGSHIMTVYGGMTLRDYFAAKAMQGWLTTYTGDVTCFMVSTTAVAKFSYQMADAMLKAREVA